MESVYPPFFQEDVPLSVHTTIGLGGKARYFASCDTDERLKEAVGFARRISLPWIVMGGGSNLIFPDRGFSGVVLKIANRGIIREGDGTGVIIRVQAGENWDSFVKWSIEQELAGIECLSGIPGLVGATPIQNVGAYGQEVGETIVSVRALDSNTMNVVTYCPLSGTATTPERKPRLRDDAEYRPGRSPVFTTKEIHGDRSRGSEQSVCRFFFCQPTARPGSFLSSGGALEGTGRRRTNSFLPRREPREGPCGLVS
jgi:hypothetical protein